MQVIRVCYKRNVYNCVLHLFIVSILGRPTQILLIMFCFSTPSNEYQAIYSYTTHYFMTSIQHGQYLDQVRRRVVAT